MIEVLFFDGCPNHVSAVELARSVVEEVGANEPVREIEISDPSDADRQRFLGSPTIRVDGVDIEPGASERTDFGLSCRVYGDSGLPPREFLVAALSGRSER